MFELDTSVTPPGDGGKAWKLTDVPVKARSWKDAVRIAAPQTSKHSNILRTRMQDFEEAKEDTKITLVYAWFGKDTSTYEKHAVDWGRRNGLASAGGKQMLAGFEYAPNLRLRLGFLRGVGVLASDVLGPGTGIAVWSAPRLWSLGLLSKRKASISSYGGFWADLTLFAFVKKEG